MRLYVKNAVYVNYLPQTLLYGTSEEYRHPRKLESPSQMASKNRIAAGDMRRARMQP